MMQYAVLIYAAQSAGGADGDPEELQAHDRHATELAESGCLTAAFDPGGTAPRSPRHTS
jgi:hypothetical protein